MHEDTFTTGRGWTFGVELEWPDVDTRLPLLEGWRWSETDYTVVSSNGVANDPKRRLMRYGGELNSPPMTSPEELGAEAARMWVLMQPGYNYRSNLHVHVRVPGLEKNVEALKAVAAFTRRHLPANLEQIDPLRGLLATVEPGTAEHAGAKKRLTHSRRSRHYFVPARRAAARAAAPTVEAALAAECPTTRVGGTAWHLAPREALNLRSLRKHGTVEFRCFAAPRHADELVAACEVARQWLLAAWNNTDPAPLTQRYAWHLPRQGRYEHHLEVGWSRTNLHTNTRAHVTEYLREKGLLGCV